MQLVLTGIIAGNDPQNGLAILGPNPQSAKVYAVGDTIAGGPKLHSVYSDRVVIDRDGQLESLALPHQVNPNAPPPSAAMLQGGENPALEHMRRMITEQPGLIGDVMRPQPVMDHGHMNGFRVYPGRDRAAFARLGLRPGDQVTAINGTPLDDRDRSEQILKTLSSASEARVTVIRGGQTQDLVLNIAQLAQEADSVAAQAQASGVVPPNAMPPPGNAMGNIAPPPPPEAPPETQPGEGGNSGP
jgi:general secretion pathway protein C